MSENTPTEETKKAEGLHVTPTIFLSNEVLASLDIKKFSREKFINGRGEKKTVIELSQTLLDDHGIPVRSDERHYLQQALVNLLYAQKRRSLSKDLDGMNEIYSLARSVNPVTDYSTGEVYFLHNATHELVNIHEEVFMSANDMDTIQRKELLALSKFVSVEFNPNSKKKIYRREGFGMDIPVVNLYDDPIWMRYEPTSSQIPEYIRELFVNAFPEADDREYVYKWFYRAVCANKNETILCLIGSQGIGKDFLVNLLAHGVGSKFYQKADQSILSDKFNAQVKYCRLLFLDEVKVGDVVEENKLKGLTSTNISYQAKGQDATTMESFINIVLANNNKDALPVKPGDRRLSIPKLGTTKLERHFINKYGPNGKSKLQEFHNYLYQGVKDSEGNRKIKPHEDVINFFHWLKSRYEADSSARDGNTPWQKEYYHELTLNNMTEWQKKMYEAIIDTNNLPVIYLKDMKKGIDEVGAKTFPSSAKTIEKFLDTYSYRGRFNLAHLLNLKQGSKTEKVLVLTDQYLEVLYPENYIEMIDIRDKILRGEDYTKNTQEEETEDLPIIVENASEDSDHELL